jgi:hypothetical protein
MPRVVSGTITSVNGHLVTIARSNGSIVVNDQPALDSRTTGNVAAGRQVVAEGYWRDGTFYVTSFADANVYGVLPPSAGPGGPMAGRLRGAVRGTITAVSGSTVTVSNGAQSIVINDRPALNRKLTGSVSVGRSIVAVGYWRGGTFYATTITGANGSEIPEAVPDFGAYTRVPDSLSGTITAVKGNEVTLQQSAGTIVVNDQPALNRKSTGTVAVGRQVVADGYWLHGTFFVTGFADATP